MRRERRIRATKRTEGAGHLAVDRGWFVVHHHGDCVGDIVYGGLPKPD